MSKTYTRDQIELLVTSSDKAAMRAVCALFRQQTMDEQTAEKTRHDNSRGFSQAHAKVGSELTAWMTSGRADGVMRRRTGGTFPKWFRNPQGSARKWTANKSAFAGRSRIEVCREIALHYAGQLTLIANGML